ncbi:MAG TPA: GntR family transcriptional regulator [Bryobacteraceae bacterium]|nr:GntR family transcriptional regulator [Bryobacteraceae bacterium]
MQKRREAGSVNATQSERAYRALKSAILKGDIAEGLFLDQAEMMRRYQIGRTPYREACNRLLHEETLEVVPRVAAILFPK